MLPFGFRLFCQLPLAARPHCNTLRGLVRPVLDCQPADLFGKIRLNGQNTVSERIVKLIAQIFKIRVVAADGIVFELYAAIIESHRPLAVNGFCNVEIVKKDRCFRVRIGASVDLTAGGQTEQAHTQTCCDEERFELHRITSVFRE